MPIVPQRSPVPIDSTPLRRPLPGVRVIPNAPEDAFGPPQLPNMSGVQQQIGALYEREKAKANQIAVNDADNQASTLRDKVLYGNDENPGILVKKGKDAIAGRDDALNQWQQGVSDITNGLSNDDQKLAFKNRIDGYDHAMHLEINSHAASEHQRYDTETTTSYVGNRVNDASTSFATPQAVDDNIAKANAAWTDYAKRNGKPSEWLQEQQQSTTSTARLSVLQQMLVATDAQGGGDLKASAYLAQHRGEFTARDLAEADRLTEAGSVKGESYRVSDGILQSATTLSDALGKAAQTQDPKVREETERRIRQHFADEAASDRDTRNAAFTRSSQFIMGGGTVDQLPLPDRVLLSPNEFDELDRTSQRIRNPVVVTPPSYYTHWMNMAGLNDTTRQEFLDHNFGADRAAGKLSEQHYEHFESLKLQIRNRETAADARDDRTAQAQTTRLRRGEEAQVFKQGKAALEYDRTSARTDSLFKGAFKSPRPQVTPPRWMVDSAQADPEYKDYLKFHGVDVDAPTQPAAAPARVIPTAPGLPVKP